VAAYLLGTQSLVELARRVPNPVKRWADSIPTTGDQIYISVVSIGQIQSEIDKLRPDDPEKPLWQAHFRAAVAQFSPMYVLGVDESIAMRWATLLPLTLTTTDKSGQQVDLAADSRLLLATAMERNLIVVDAVEHYHRVLAAHGLRSFDPYSGTALP
jgi:predicted nucleic acid-binding protein